MPARSAYLPGAAVAPPPAMAAGLGRNVVSIQFLRFVAAIAVVLFHTHQIVSRGVADHPQAIAYLFGLGAAGVHIFFCISGFVMVYTSFCHDGPFRPGDFLLKRGLRIYPIYWLCMAAYVLFHVATRSTYRVTPGEVIGAIALWPGYGAVIIGPAWTLVFEVYFYLCFSAFMITGFGRGLTLMTAFFLASVLLKVVAPAVPLDPLLTDSLLLEFVAGAWLGRFAITRPQVLAALWPIALLLGVAGFVAGYVLGYDRLPSALAWGIPSLLLLAGTIGMEAAGRLPHRVAAFAFLGDGSYFLYLSHILLVDMLMLTPLAWLRGSPAGIVLATAIITTLVAALSVPAFTWLERPLLRHLRRLTRRR